MMDKNNTSEIIIDEEFKLLLPKLDKVTFEGLEKNILAYGVRDPLVLWNGILIDGYNRHKICTTHNLPFHTISMEFPSRDAVLQWIVDNQLGRRNLNPVETSHFRGIYFNAAKRIQGTNNQHTQKSENHQSDGFQNKFSTAREVGKKFNVSSATIERDGRVANALGVIADISPEANEKILSGEVPVDRSKLQRLSKAPKEEVEEVVRQINAGTYNRNDHRVRKTQGDGSSVLGKTQDPGQASTKGAIIMRTEKEVLDLIIDTAKNDERIRAVSMEGSRADPNAIKDKYQDYDISFYVTDVQSFVIDKSWISTFGTPLIIQEPDWIDNVTEWFSDEKHDFQKSYAYLMLFNDGVRIDLSIRLISEEKFSDTGCEPTITLLDKDNIIPSRPTSTDKVYWVEKPNKDKFSACCNEFWWCLNNVAKGIARDELSYAMNMYNLIVRNMLHKMIEWHIGIENNFSVSAGKDGRYFKRYLPPELYEEYRKTYSDSNYKNLWDAVFTACDLFHTIAIKVADYLGVEYNQSDEDGMMKYLISIKGESYA